MASIGRLVVDIVANTSQLTKGLNKGKVQVEKFSTHIQKASGRVLKFGAALTGVAVGGGLAVFLRNQLQAIDSLAKTSDKLGTTTEALAGLRFAAEQTGVASRTLDMALQRMTRRVSEAAQDTGEAKDAIKELGLNAQALVRLAPDQQFAAIADAMNKVTNQADKVRLSFKLFDSEGVAVVNTLKLGSSGLADMRKQAEKFGLAVDQESARSVEELNNRLNELRAITTGIGRRILIEVAPEAIKALEGVVELAKVAREAQREVRAVTGGQGLSETARGAVARSGVGGFIAIKGEELLKRGIAEGVDAGFDRYFGADRGPIPRSQIKLPPGRPPGPVSGDRNAKETADNTSKQLMEDKKSNELLNKISMRLTSELISIPA